MSSQPHQQLRLNKFLAERLGVSRREADELISAGKITVNGKIAKLGAKVDLPTKQDKDRISEDNIDKYIKVCYNGKIVPFETAFSYLALNKPEGFVCSRRSQGAPTIYEILPQKYHNLKSVGRLDKDSSGLILLTNDGDFAFQMTHPKFRKTKVYEVELDKPLEPLHQQMISDYGVEIGDGVSRFKILRKETCRTSSEGYPQLLRGHSDEPREDGREERPEEDGSEVSYLVFLTEGRNRQIRRTFAALGYTVTRLHRIQFGKYELGDLKPGKYVIIEP